MDRATTLALRSDEAAAEVRWATNGSATGLTGVLVVLDGCPPSARIPDAIASALRSAWPCAGRKGAGELSQTMCGLFEMADCGSCAVCVFFSAWALVRSPARSSRRPCVRPAGSRPRRHGLSVRPSSGRLRVARAHKAAHQRADLKDAAPQTMGRLTAS
jgi:hypothetical protein